ncbi:MAG: hypothetical protein WBW27_06345, partial [Pseudolabrys sp.]
NYIAPIKHREFNDRPIEVVTPDLALLQRHCEYSISEGFDCATSPMEDRAFAEIQVFDNDRRIRDQQLLEPINIPIQTRACMG